VALPYSKRFFAARALARGENINWTVPEGKVHVVRDISGLLHMPQGSCALLGPLEETLAQFSTSLTEAPDWIHGESFHWEGRLVFSEGEKPLVVGLFNLVDIAVSGYELSAS
jgi:hypothetical protein